MLCFCPAFEPPTAFSRSRRSKSAGRCCSMRPGSDSGSTWASPIAERASVRIPGRACSVRCDAASAVLLRIGIAIARSAIRSSPVRKRPFRPHSRRFRFDTLRQVDGDWLTTNCNHSSSRMDEPPLDDFRRHWPRDCFPSCPAHIRTRRL